MCLTCREAAATSTAWGGAGVVPTLQTVTSTGKCVPGATLATAFSDRTTRSGPLPNHTSPFTKVLLLSTCSSGTA
ncbi:hypothetical protein D7V80_01100 [Corallococcus sp. CA054B]|nr:hypothetical protein D7V80_01100 [Corallococcus sp. CA054B]